MRRSAPYLFFGETTSLCETCHRLVPAKILIEGSAVFYRKRCVEHGVQKTLISTDVAYFKLCLDYLKPGDRPLRFQTKTEYGCPYDCGLCPDHEQHSCLALIEINEACNLTCPVCFAGSSTRHTLQRPLAEVQRMIDTLVASEGEPDLVQISGGEPTLHPEILSILHAAQRSPIRHLMVNTNGLRIGSDRKFVEQLAGLEPGFEVYLQFDSLRPSALKELRGTDLSKSRRAALDALEELGISTTLVVVVKRGVNDDELGAIVDFALNYRCVRGVVYQPIQDAGRNQAFDKNRHRMVLSEIRSRLLEQSQVFGEADLIPLPCNPESIAIGYGLRNGRRVVPVTSLLPREELVKEVPNSITFEKYPELHRRIFDLLSLSTGPANTEERLAELLCCLPRVEVPEELGYEHTFRVAIIEFLDAFNFSIGRVKRSCIHFVTTDGRIVPFDTYNLFYRNGTIDRIRRRQSTATSFRS